MPRTVTLVADFKKADANLDLSSGPGLREITAALAYAAFGVIAPSIGDQDDHAGTLLTEGAFR